MAFICCLNSRNEWCFSGCTPPPHTCCFAPKVCIIHSALGVAISALFAEPEPSKVVYRGGERPQLRVPANTHGGVVIERLVPHTPDHILECNIHIVAPGDGSEGSIGHEGEEVGYVLEGQLELVIDGTTYNVYPGDSFTFRSELPHSYINHGSTTARILWANTPPPSSVRARRHLHKIVPRGHASRS